MTKGMTALYALRSHPQKVIAACSVLALLLLAGYSLAPSDFWSRATGTRSPKPATTFAQSAEVVRGRDGSFSIMGQINGARVALVVDTGASAVILTQDAARAAGLRLETLSYSVDVHTANGPARAAPIIVDQITVGGITERSIRALITRPGQLDTNLLGMSFLSRLESWEVHGDTLTMRGRR